MSKAKQLPKKIQAKHLAIGLFITAFNQLDARLGEAIGVLANKDDAAVGEIIGAAVNSFHVKCNIVAGLIGHLGGKDLLEKYNKLDTALRDINTKRNALVHGEHWIDPSDFSYRLRNTKTTSKGFISKHLDYSTSEVNGWAGEALSLEADLWMFIHNVHLK